VLLSLAALSACDNSPTAVSKDDRTESTLAGPKPDLGRPVRIAGTDLEARFSGLKQAAAERKSMLKPQFSVTAGDGISITVPDDYPTIQAAVDAAPPGATITVREGTYVEPGGVYVYTPGLTIVGKDAIQVGGFGIIADDVTLENFRIIFDDFIGVGVVGKGVRVIKNEVSGPEGVECTFSVCQIGIGYFSSSEVTVEQNKVSGTAFGILSYNSRDGIINQNTVSGTTIAGAIQLESNSTENTITKNTLESNQDGIVFWNSYGNTATNNKILQVGLNGVFLGFSHFNLLEKNTSTDAVGQSIFLYDSSDNELNNNTTGGSINGFVLIFAHRNSVANNRASGNVEKGISLFLADENLISHNMASENGDVGIKLDNSSLNTVEQNTALENGSCDILDLFGFDNTIQKNEAECIESIPAS